MKGHCSWMQKRKSIIIIIYFFSEQSESNIWPIIRKAHEQFRGSLESGDFTPMGDFLTVCIII